MGVKQQCLALTKKGEQCRNPVFRGGRYCFVHSVTPRARLGWIVNTVVPLITLAVGYWLGPSKADVAAVPELTAVAVRDTLISQGLLDPERQREVEKRINLAYGGINDATQEDMDAAVSALRNGDFPDAEASYRRLIEKYPGEPSFYTNLSFALRRQGRYKDAVAPAKRAAELATSSPFVWMVLGTALSDAGFPEEGKRAYRNAISLQKSLPDVYMSIGATYSEQDSLETARLFYDSALMYDRENPFLFFNLANLFRKQGHADSSVMALGKAVRLRPEDTRWRYGYAQQLFQTGRTEEAWLQFQIVIQEDPSLLRELFEDTASGPE